MAALVLVILIPCARVEAAEMFRAGLARVDITPGVALRLLSTPTDMGPTAELDQRLFARVLVLEDASGVGSVLVSFDGSSVPHGLRQRICGSVRPRFGIYRVRIAVCATGAEATPILDGGIGAGATAEERASIEQYTRLVTVRILQAISEAHASRHPVRLQFGRAADPDARQDDGDGDGDGNEAGSTGWPYLALRHADGALAALVFGMTRRATSEDPSANRLSAGWPGRAARALERTFEKALVLPVAGLDSATGPRSDESQRASRSLRETLRIDASGAPGPETAARLDCRFEYASLTTRDGGSLKYPLQVWSVTAAEKSRPWTSSIPKTSRTPTSRLNIFMRQSFSSPSGRTVEVPPAPTGVFIVTAASRTFGCSRNRCLVSDGSPPG